MSREKQIEELTKILLTGCEGACTDCEYYERYDGSVCIPIRLANVLYTAGYRKQREAKWVDNHCTACGMTPIGEETWTNYDITPPKFEWCMDYCPCCGAHMKGANDEN